MPSQQMAGSFASHPPIELHSERLACSSCAALGIPIEAGCVHLVIPGDNLGPRWKDYRLEAVGCRAVEVIPPGIPFVSWGDRRFLLWVQRLYYSDAACYAEVTWKPGMQGSEWRLVGLGHEPRPKVWKALSDGLDRLMLGTDSGRNSDRTPGARSAVRIVEQIALAETETLHSDADSAPTQRGWAGQQSTAWLAEYRMGFEKLRRQTLGKLKA